MPKNKYNKTKVILTRVNKRHEKKLDKLQKKFHLRDNPKVIRHLIEKEEV